MGTQSFRHFEPSLIDFLDELAENNDRDWFNANKARYESEVVVPAMAFVEAMAPRLESISPHFLAIAKKTGGSMMRIYRDTRFAKDKRPYKTNLGIQFRHERGKDIHAPGFYVHLEPASVFLGAGMWRPDATGLAGIRRGIDLHPEGWHKARAAKAFTRTWELGGDSLKRAPRGYDEDHPQIEDLKRKDFIATRSLATDRLYQPRLLDEVTKAFEAAGDFVAFLCDSVGVSY